MLNNSQVATYKLTFLIVKHQNQSKFLQDNFEVRAYQLYQFDVISPRREDN